MTRHEAGSADGLVARARTMAADAAAAEVAEALRARGIRSILLKGPVLEAWLYDEGERDYVDADLLVPPDGSSAAEALLRELGFEPVREAAEVPARGVIHSQPWMRGADLAHVDLHRTLFGVGVGPDRTWAEICRGTETIEVGGARLEILAPAVRALVVSMHAAQHEGQERAKPLEDLRRAIERAPMDTWREAVGLAERLNATPTMALGLGLSPEGRALAGRLDIVDPALARAATERRSRAGLAVGFERLANAPGLRAKAALVAREVVPERDFIYGWSPIARRGRRGMALMYLWRPVWLALMAVPSFLAWRRHRRGRAQ